MSYLFRRERGSSAYQSVHCDGGTCAAARTGLAVERSGDMARFYFHLFNDLTSIDEEGVDLPNVAAAMERAIAYAREMAAESVREGHLVLDHRIDLANDARQTIETVYFGDVVRVKQTACDQDQRHIGGKLPD